MITPETPAEMLFFVTAHLVCRKAGQEWTGTGFFIRASVIGSADQLLLVTNRHVISDPDLGDVDSVDIYTPASNPAASSQPLLGQRASAVTPGAKFESHPDSEIDVAVTNITDISTAGPYERFIKALPVQMLFNEESLRRLDALEQVTFIGYPNDIFDEVNMTPVARHGWTATPISLDYGGEPTFLIDASVFPGSSGSPVLALNTGAYQERIGAVLYGNPRITLLGVVAAVYTYPTTGELTVTHHDPEVTVDQMMNLGIVYKVPAIVETIDHYLSTNGLTRAPPNAATAVTGPVDPP